MTPDQAVTELTSVRRRLLAELEGFDDERFARVPPRGSWSAGHVAEHLVRVESRIARGARVVLEKGSPVRPGPFDWLRKLPLELGLADLVRIRTVPGADPAKDGPEPLPRAQMLERLAATRAESVAFLESVRGRELSRTWLRHPFFGAFSIPDMFGWVAWHEERHRRQVTRLRRALGLR